MRLRQDELGQEPGVKPGFPPNSAALTRLKGVAGGGLKWLEQSPAGQIHPAFFFSKCESSHPSANTLTPEGSSARANSM